MTGGIRRTNAQSLDLEDQLGGGSVDFHPKLVSEGDISVFTQPVQSAKDHLGLQIAITVDSQVALEPGRVHAQPGEIFGWK